MAEVLKHGGNIADALKDDKNVPKTFDIAKLKELANSVNTKDDKQSEHYDIK